MSRKFLAIVITVLVVVSCQTPHDAPLKASTALPAQPSQAKAQPDPLLGKWVCLADNVSENPKHTMDFRADGTVVMLFDGEKPYTVRYKRQSGKEWSEKRGSSPGAEPKDMPWNRPGAEMISFAGPDGKFIDWGGTLLTLHPKEQVLVNPLTQLWCRPGDEARVRQISGMDAREAQAKKEEARRRAWRPKKDITKQLREIWKVDLPGEDRGDYGVVAGDVDGDGTEEAVVSGTNGVLVVDGRGKVIRRLPVDSGPNPYLVLGKNNGNIVVAHFAVWGHSMSAYGTTGKLIWTISARGGMDWVAPMRIDAHNTGFLIGYNGGGGIDLVNPKGKTLWHVDVDANVWSVAAGKFDEGVAEAAICVGGDGALAYDVKGKRLHEYGPEDVEAVGAADLDGDGIDEVLTLGVTVKSGMKVTAFDAKGKRLWSHKASDSGTSFVEGNPFVFGMFGKERLLGIADGAAIRFFRGDGSWLGDAMIPGRVMSIAKLSRKGLPDALLIRVTNQIRCYEVAALEVATSARQPLRSCYFTVSNERPPAAGT
jgi:hypothetical protein